MPTQIESNNILITGLEDGWLNAWVLCRTSGVPLRAAALRGNQFKKPRIKIHNQEMRLI